MKNSKKILREEDGYQREVGVKIIEEQKEYFYIRMFLNSELSTNLVPNTKCDLVLDNTSERLEMVFFSYGKNGDIDKIKKNDNEDTLIEYDDTVNETVLIFMFDMNSVRDKRSNNFPTLRKLFKFSPYYDMVLLRKNDIYVDIPSLNIEIRDYFTIYFN